jgi:hypothetical protein
MLVNQVLVKARENSQSVMKTSTEDIQSTVHLLVHEVLSSHASGCIYSLHHLSTALGVLAIVKHMLVQHSWLSHGAARNSSFK